MFDVSIAVVTIDSSYAMNWILSFSESSFLLNLQIFLSLQHGEVVGDVWQRWDSESVDGRQGKGNVSACLPGTPNMHMH
jgi:hypothetical protein